MITSRSFNYKQSYFYGAAISTKKNLSHKKKFIILAEEFDCMLFCLIKHRFSLHFFCGAIFLKSFLLMFFCNDVSVSKKLFV